MLNYFNEKDQSGNKSDSSPEGLQRLFAPGAPGKRDTHLIPINSNRGYYVAQ